MTDRVKKIYSLVLISLVSAISNHSLLGASATWSATPTDSNWVATGVENNWSTGAATFPGSTASTTNTDTATFTGPSTILTITLNASVNVKNITFSGSSEPAYTIGTVGGNSLLLTSGGSVSISSTASGANTTNSVNSPIVLEPATATTAGTYTFSNAGGTTSHPLVIGGSVSGGTTTQGIALTLTGSNSGANSVNGIISNGGASGGLSILKSSSGTWTLANTNSYSGGTSISGGSLIAGADGALGSGNISLTAGSVNLTLQNGVTQNYIGDTANLNIGFTGDTVALNFTGTDTVGSLTVLGVQEAPGIYGSPTNLTPGITQLSVLTGTGTLTVLSTIPEPSTYGMVGLGAALLLLARSARRKRA